MKPPRWTHRPPAWPEYLVIAALAGSAVAAAFAVAWLADRLR